MRRYTGETCSWPCRWCGTSCERRRFVDEFGEPAWETVEHEAPCGLPCRPLAQVGKVHARRWCSSCGAITPRVRRQLIRRAQRRARSARRKAA